MYRLGHIFIMVNGCAARANRTFYNLVLTIVPSLLWRTSCPSATFAIKIINVSLMNNDNLCNLGNLYLFIINLRVALTNLH